MNTKIVNRRLDPRYDGTRVYDIVVMTIGNMVLATDQTLSEEEAVQKGRGLLEALAVPGAEIMIRESRVVRTIELEPDPVGTKV